MWFPKKYHYNQKILPTMKVDLNISAASTVVTMACCPKWNEQMCGIMYRSE